MRRRTEPRITDAQHHPTRYVGVNVAAAYLEVHPMTLRKFVRDGLLDYVWIGARRRFEVTELVAFERRQRVGRKGA